MYALKGWCPASWLYLKEVKVCSLVSYDSAPRVHSLQSHLQAQPSVRSILSDPVSIVFQDLSMCDKCARVNRRYGRLTIVQGIVECRIGEGHVETIIVQKFL